MREVSIIPTVEVTIDDGAVPEETQSFSFYNDSSICKSDKSDSCKVRLSDLFSSPKMIVFCDISCSDAVLLTSSTAICTGELSLSVQLGIASKLLFTSLELSSTFKGHYLVSEIKDSLPSTVLIKPVEISIVSFSHYIYIYRTWNFGIFSDIEKICANSKGQLKKKWNFQD